MENVFGLFGVVGVFVAIWQLHLQRKEYQRTSRVSVVLFLIQKIEYEIERAEQQIASLKEQGKVYSRLANKINKESVPKRDALYKELVLLSGDERVRNVSRK